MSPHCGSGSLLPGRTKWKKASRLCRRDNVPRRKSPAMPASTVERPPMSPVCLAPASPAEAPSPAQPARAPGGFPEVGAVSQHLSAVAVCHNKCLALLVRPGAHPVCWQRSPICFRGCSPARHAGNIPPLPLVSSDGEADSFHDRNSLLCLCMFICTFLWQ